MLLSISIIAVAQVTDSEAALRKRNSDTTQGWKYGGIFAVTLSQTSLTNWAAGGEESLTLNGMASLSANYRRGNNVWTNSLDLGYGIISKEGNFKNRMKTDDKIDILSKYGRKAFEGVYYSALANVKTQSTAGYKYPNDSVAISDFLAPAYLIGAIGIDYQPNKYFSAFAAPITSKTTYVNSQQLSDIGAFGVEAAQYDANGVKTKDGERIKQELGGYIRVILTKSDFQNEWLKNVSFTTKIDLFSNYLKNPDCIDVNWETQVLFKINKLFSVNLQTHIIYDDDVTFTDKAGNNIGPQIQFKELLGVGLSYKF